MKGSRTGAILTAALISAMAPARSGCAFPWSIDMFRGPQAEALAIAPRVMPEGTVPTTGGEPRMTPEQLATLSNPIKPNPRALASGKVLFDTDCAACHGALGHGDGSAAHVLRVRPIDLRDPSVVELSDGFIYGVIRDGFRNMPALADAMSARERWEVVLYVRQIQGGALPGGGESSSSLGRKRQPQ